MTPTEGQLRDAMKQNIGNALDAEDNAWVDEAWKLYRDGKDEYLKLAIKRSSELRLLVKRWRDLAKLSASEAERMILLSCAKELESRL